MSAHELTLALHSCEARIARCRTHLGETVAPAKAARIAEVIATLDDALDELCNATGASRFARSSDLHVATTAIGRHSIAIGRLASEQAISMEGAQRSAVLRLAADVRHDAHRLCVALFEALGDLRQ